MDLRKLKTLIDLVSESNISELEITEAEGKVRIVKGGVAAPVQYVQAVATPAAGPAIAGARQPPLSARRPQPLPPAMPSSPPWWAPSIARPAPGPPRSLKLAAK